MTLNDPYRQIQGHAIDADYLRNGATYRHSVIEQLLSHSVSLNDIPQ